MEFISFLQETLIAQLPNIIASYEGTITAQDLSKMETARVVFIRYISTQRVQAHRVPFVKMTGSNGIGGNGGS